MKSTLINLGKRCPMGVAMNPIDVLILISYIRMIKND